MPIICSRSWLLSTRLFDVVDGLLAARVVEVDRL